MFKLCKGGKNGYCKTYVSRWTPQWVGQSAQPNRGIIYSLGLSPNYLVTLEVVGRKSGKTISFPLVMTVIDGERYLVAMLGEETNWVKNVRAAEGRAALRHGITEQVHVEEVGVEHRAPILKAYLQRAPGARPHMAISKDAPVAEFATIAAQYPVFRLATVD